MAFCSKCGAQLEDGVQFCPSCGAPVGGEAAPAPAPVASGNLSIEILKRAIAVIMQKPIYLWGLSLLVTFLTGLATTLGGAVPLIGISIGLILEFGMAFVYLEGYRGNGVKIDQVFEGFYNNFWHTLSAMGWKEIVLLLWFIVPLAIGGGLGFAIGGSAVTALIESAITAAVSNMFGGFGYYGSSFGGPNLGSLRTAGILVGLMIFLIIVGLIVGIVFYCIKTYAYSFVPYIIREDETRRAVDVARESDARTKGYKGKMFLTDLLVVLCIVVVEVVLTFLGKIPAVGVVFNFVKNLVSIVVSLFTPLLFGLIRAAWYEEISKNRA